MLLVCFLLVVVSNSIRKNVLVNDVGADPNFDASTNVSTQFLLHNEILGNGDFSLANASMLHKDAAKMVTIVY